MAIAVGAVSEERAAASPAPLESTAGTATVAMKRTTRRDRKQSKKSHSKPAVGLGQRLAEEAPWWVRFRLMPPRGTEKWSEMDRLRQLTIERRKNWTRMRRQRYS